ncbi:MAG: SPOR domain-containing protein [Treponema sp.]|jgi:tetratricopeptide (TPR) repeat protein|nr:SPOR domain-containing protein [Treponema sp.]
MKKDACIGVRGRLRNIAILRGNAVKVCSSLFLLFFVRYGFTESMVVEVLRFEKIAASSSSASERKAAYTQMARLLYLAGDMERAAVAWQNAALTDKNNRDDAALLEAAACFIAMGAFDAASANVRMALVSGKSSSVIPKARYLAATIEAFRGFDIAPLIALLPDPAYERYKPSIYYIAWRISGTSDYRTKLFSEYPNSPETLSIKDGKTVSAFPSVFWQFLPSGAEEAPLPSQMDMLQAGMFSVENNALYLVKRLMTAGFEAETGKKTVNGRSYWVVLTPGGENIAMSLARLKAAGFDAFPVKRPSYAPE